MKYIVSFITVLYFGLNLSAQETDSALLEEVVKLRIEVAKLESGQRKLNSKIVTSSREHDVELEELRAEIAKNRHSLEEVKTRISELKQVVGDNKTRADEKLESVEGQLKRLLGILGIVLIILIVILFLLVISNRSRIGRRYLALEAKTDNDKKSFESEIRNVQKKHDEDLESLRSAIDNINK